MKTSAEGREEFLQLRGRWIDATEVKERSSAKRPAKDAVQFADSFFTAMGLERENFMRFAVSKPLLPSAVRYGPIAESALPLMALACAPLRRNHPGFIVYARSENVFRMYSCSSA